MALGTLITTRSSLFKKGIENLTLDELIVKPTYQKGNYNGKEYEMGEPNQSKGTIDYFIEVIYSRIKMVDFLNEFAFNFDFLSPNDYEDLINKPLKETKFLEYLLNDFRFYCHQIYNNPKYYEENPFMAFLLKQTLKQWITNIERVFTEERKKELFERAYKKRIKLTEKNISDI